MRNQIILSVIIIAILGAPLFAQGGAESNRDAEPASAADAVAEEEDAQVLDDGFKEVTEQGFRFRWRTAEDYIEFTMEAPTTGWVAVAFKPSFMMKDADFTLAYIKDGEISATDDYGVANTSHQPDTRLGGEDNITVLGGRELDGSTMVQIRRPLDSGDEYDSVLTPGETMKVIFAWGNADNFTAIHARRGSFTIDL